LAVGRQVLRRVRGALERACFDYVILEDTLMVSEAYRGTAETALTHALQVPKHDPVPLAAMMAAMTPRLGIVATMSTMVWPPFMLARVSITIDHIAGGRFARTPPLRISAWTSCRRAS
jgi:alkanesulfonate monooxygenase SsuD/methylene tetrahydromethanopterin reductase-like flavin-dependent oxidoreductase (luciferase family)